MDTLQILTGLRDVEGIIGSFVMSSNGSVVGRDLPSMFDDDTLLGVAPRLLRLRDGIASEGVDPTALVLRFSEHKLHVRPAGSGLLCVLTESTVNTPALRVGMKLVARRIAPITEQRPPPVEARPPTPPPVTERSRATPPPIRSAPPSTGAPPSAAAAPSSRAGLNEMIYRGNKVRG